MRSVRVSPTWVVRAGDAAEILGEADRGGPVLNGIDFSPNANVARFGDRLYATVEGGAAPVEISPELETMARSDLNGALTDGFSGYHKIDPTDSDVHAVVYSMVLGQTAIYLRLSPQGRVINRVEIPLGGLTQIHDMSITKNYAVIYDLNVAFDPSAEGDSDRWVAAPLDEGERSLGEIADWGPAEDWSDWALDATG